MKFSDLRLRARALFKPAAVERELDDELAFHLECETRKLVTAGLGAEEARQRALARFGAVPLAADRCRDERGISFVETLAGDTGFALRMLRRTPLVALTVVATIALGLGVVAVAFTFFDTFLFRVDAVRNPDELFAMERPARPGSRSVIPFTRPEYEAIHRETDVFTDVVATRPDVTTRVNGRPAVGMFVSGNFFEMLGVAAARGRTLTQADNDNGGRAVVVLSRRGWEKLFDTDAAVIGRQLVLNGHPYDVAGVMPDDFRGLRQQPPDYWAPLALVDQFVFSEPPAQAWVDVIGRLKPGRSPDAAAAALTAWASAQPGIRKPDSGVLHVILRESRGVVSKDRAEAMLVAMPILFAFGLILMIGCANVANLLLARGLSRQREIGVRLSLGATRGRIVRQLLTENLMLALVAAALAYLVSRALFAGSVFLILTILPPEFLESTDIAVLPADWRVVLFLFAGALVSTVLFGLVPALHSTRLELVRAMRGEVTRDARPSRVRQMLIGSQVTASAVLLVCAAVFLRGTYSAATADAGVRTNDTVVVGRITESRRPALVQALNGHPSVASIAASWPGPTDNDAFTQVSVGDTSVGVGCKLISPGYFDVLGISLLRGRLFAAEERSPAAGVVVISDAVARRFWPNADPLGQVIRLGAASGPATTSPGAPRIPAHVFSVIGVVRDVRSALTMLDVGYSGIYLPTTPERANTSLILRVHGDPDTARRTLLDALTKVDPDLAGITTMKMMAGLETAILEVAFWMAMILGSLALALTVSGLFSVTVVSRRAAQDRNRRAHGAWRQTPRHRDPGGLAVDAADRHWCRRRRRARRGHGCGAPGNACGRDGQHAGASFRSGRLRRQPRRDHRDVSNRRIPSSAAGSAHQSDRNAAHRLSAAGLKPDKLAFERA